MDFLCFCLTVFLPIQAAGRGCQLPDSYLLHPNWWYLGDPFSNDWPWGMKAHRDSYPGIRRGRNIVSPGGICWLGTRLSVQAP